MLSKSNLLVARLDWANQYRVIPSKFPPINFFEGLVDPDLMDEAYYVESLTNDRIREEVGDISLVQSIDRVSGHGASPVMAAFTHIGNKSRFSDGAHGVYYASEYLETAIAETRFHREEFLLATNEDPGEVDMRVYIGKVERPMHDVRSKEFEYLHDPKDWKPSQSFGALMKLESSWGIVYNSVRHLGFECIAALRPPAVSIPVQGKHLSYIWNGMKIIDVIEKKTLKI